MNALLQKIRARAKNTGMAPDIHQIEEMANFRERGGLGRCLAALSEVGAEHLRPVPLPVEAIVTHIFERCEVMDDGEDPKCIVATADELREALAGLAR